MKVYVAGPYQQKEAIGWRAAELRAVGIEVTSRWLEEPHSPTTQCGDLPDATFRMYANYDLEDIDAADAFLLFAVPPNAAPIPRAGRHVEFGYALARRKKIFVVGDVKENIFHYLPQVKHFENFALALAYFVNRNADVTGQ